MDTLIAVYGCGYEPRATFLKRPSARYTSINSAVYREYQRPPQTWYRVPNLARQVKGSEGDLHRSDNLLCEQRRNQSRLPSRVGRQDANAVGWGSEIVIVVGVTSHQGARESRAQGEGPQNSMFQVNPRQAAVGRITKPISKELPDEQCRGRNGTPVQKKIQARSSSERRVRGNAPARCGEGWAETCGSNVVTRRPSTP